MSLAMFAPVFRRIRRIVAPSEPSDSAWDFPHGSGNFSSRSLESYLVADSQIWRNLARNATGKSSSRNGRSWSRTAANSRLRTSPSSTHMVSTAAVTRQITSSARARSRTIVPCSPVIPPSSRGTNGADTKLASSRAIGNPPPWRLGRCSRSAWMFLERY